ncbi:hypothetical protein [Nocardia jiangsuensis]|uniref:Uncharacterized protein n=1 Tax=Nocardia jiangsuensis TaxID=1691563 RepID=A0ABV8DM84_9NOCA
MTGTRPPDDPLRPRHEPPADPAAVEPVPPAGRGLRAAAARELTAAQAFTGAAAAVRAVLARYPLTTRIAVRP